MHIIVYGPEGSGKGTQAKLLSQKYQLPIFTSGDLVRDAAKHDKTETGEACRDALSQGTYVCDQHMFQLWDAVLGADAAKQGFVLDGFPRTLRQAEFLISRVTEHGYSVDACVYLHLPDDIARARLLLRHRTLYEGSVESHDTPERISHRLSVYRREEARVLDFFRERQLLVQIDGTQPIERVFSDIVSRLDVA